MPFYLRYFIRFSIIYGSETFREKYLQLFITCVFLSSQSELVNVEVIALNFCSNFFTVGIHGVYSSPVYPQIVNKNIGFLLLHEKLFTMLKGVLRIDATVIANAVSTKVADKESDGEDTVDVITFIKGFCQWNIVLVQS